MTSPYNQVYALLGDQGVTSAELADAERIVATRILLDWKHGVSPAEEEIHFIRKLLCIPIGAFRD